MHVICSSTFYDLQLGQKNMTEAPHYDISDVLQNLNIAKEINNNDNKKKTETFPT